MEMIKRLFLDRINILGNGVSVNQRVELSFAVFSDPAAPPAAIGNRTVKTTQVAANLTVTDAFPEFCWMEIHNKTIAEGKAVSYQLSVIRKSLQP